MSLLALKKCIKALSNQENKSNHFPFRESLLTKILQDSLAGLHNKLMLIGTVSSQYADYLETKNTLTWLTLAVSLVISLYETTCGSYARILSIHHLYVSGDCIVAETLSFLF